MSSSYAFNLARRLSNRNENDLVQESFFDDKNHHDTQDFCESLVARLSLSGRGNVAPPVPLECKKQFPTLFPPSSVKRRNSDRSDHAIAFQGMPAGEAAAAMAARERGHLHPAQIQRRLTTQKRGGQSRAWLW